METNRKKCEVHMLPTENESNIWLWEITNKLEYYGGKPSKPVKSGKSGKPQHIHITSDEKIKEGDWVYDSVFNKVYQCEEICKKRLCHSKEHVILVDNCRKVIATTDYNLYITIGELYNSYNIDLPQPSQAFLKKYCELGGIDEVMVEYTSKDWDSRTKDIMMGYGDNPDNFEKELKPKTNTHNEIAIHTVKNSWSRQEVINILFKSFYEIDKLQQKGVLSEIAIKVWIEENL